MRRRITLALAPLLALSIGLAPSAAQAADAPDCLTVPGKAGAAITATMTSYPVEKPDAYRTVDGKREPVYKVSVGDVLHVDTRLTNTGTCHYWTWRGSFITLGADVFATPGSSTYFSGIGDRVWGSSIGLPEYDIGVGMDVDAPYTRRAESLSVEIYPGDHAKRRWPLTIDSLPKANTYYPVRFRYDARVSNPPLDQTVIGGRAWLIRE
ncbi:hypothetical protein AB0O16_14515 [Microbacterium sp. NPDC089180]|uniref:hypothetical protein n=1 Tax=unclassified Microbacterium TaxID=2609290 RepID=UPI00342746D6